MKKYNIFENGVVWTVLCVMAVVAIFVFALFYRDIFGYPWFVNDNRPEKDMVQSDGDDFSALLEDELYYGGEDEVDPDGIQDEVEIIRVSEENFRTVVENIVPPEAYEWKFEVTTYSGEDSLTELNTLAFDGEKYEIAITVDGVLQRSIVDDGQNVTVSEFVPQLSSNSFPSKMADVFSLCRLATPESFLTLPPETVDFDCSLTKGVYGNIALLEFSYTIGDEQQEDVTKDEQQESLLCREKYRISLDYGLVISAETYENEALVYELETLTLKDSLEDEKEEPRVESEDMGDDGVQNPDNTQQA